MWWAVGSSPKRDLQKGEKRRGGKELFDRGYGKIQVLTLVGAQGRPARKEPLRAGMAPSRHTAKQGCLLLFLCTYL